MIQYQHSFLSDQSRNHQPDYPRKFMARVVFGWLLLLLLQFFLQNSLMHQWQQPILIYPEADNVYWILHMLYIPQFIMQNAIAASCFDFVLIFSTILFFIFPEKVIFAWISVLCFWMLQICFGSSAGHHYGHVGFLLVPICFLAKNNSKFSLLWQLVRYWILFLFVCAGVYKFYYGGFFQISNMASILKANNNHDLNGWYGNQILYLINHPSTAQLFYQAAAIIQVSFIIGFITRRFDFLIVILLFLFFLFDFLLLHISFWENFIALSVFLQWEKISAFLERTKLM